MTTCGLLRIPYQEENFNGEKLLFGNTVFRGGELPFTLTCTVAVVDSDEVIGAGRGLHVKGVKLHLHSVAPWCLHVEKAQRHRMTCALTSHDLCTDVTSPLQQLGF